MITTILIEVNYSDTSEEGSTMADKFYDTQLHISWKNMQADVQSRKQFRKCTVVSQFTS